MFIFANSLLLTFFSLFASNLFFYMIKWAFPLHCKLTIIIILTRFVKIFTNTNFHFLTILLIWTAYKLFFMKIFTASLHCLFAIRFLGTRWMKVLAFSNFYFITLLFWTIYFIFKMKVCA